MLAGSDEVASGGLRGAESVRTRKDHGGKDAGLGDFVLAAATRGRRGRDRGRRTMPMYGAYGGASTGSVV